MGTLYLVRHGQASFGADNYDQLSALGERQAERLGQYLRERLEREGQPVQSVMMGTLTRHRQTWQALARGAGWTHEPTVWPALDEYDSHALIRAVHPQDLPKPDTPERYRQHFRLLRQGLQAWMAGEVTPQGMPSHEAFVQGLQEALTHVRTQCQGPVLMVSSGGPISTMVGQILGAPAPTAIELNLRMRNTALSEVAYTPKRHMLVTYNTLPHLEGADYADWITYA